MVQRSMSPLPVPHQYILVGEQKVELPPGVTVADWSLERLRTQNPRIRSYLGCIRMLEVVLDSNYAILHCSPSRLLEIWRRVRRVSDLIRMELAPLLEEPSKIPALEQARCNAQIAHRHLATTVLVKLQSYPPTLSERQRSEVRKLLCVSIGKIYAFLQETFAEIVASDPRSLHDSDYFLSRRFPHDIEEAEWLYATVDRLRDYLQSLGTACLQELQELMAAISRDHMLPNETQWADTVVFLDLLTNGLTPRIKEVLALRGIRFDEMDTLDHYSSEIPAKCQVLTIVHETARNALGEIKAATGESSFDAREQKVADLLACHAVFSQRMAAVMSDIARALRDLMAYVPLWLESIENRRALLLERAPLLDSAEH